MAVETLSFLFRLLSSPSTFLVTCTVRNYTRLRAYRGQESAADTTEWIDDRSRYHSLTSPSPLSRTEGFPQYLPVTPLISLKPSRIGIFAPSAGLGATVSRRVPQHTQWGCDQPGVFGGRPNKFPISVSTHPGQQALMTNAGFSRASTAVIAFVAALETPYAWGFHPFWPSVPLFAAS